MAKVQVKMSFDRAMKEFDVAIQRQLNTTKRSHEQVVRRAFRGVMRRVFTFTPPMSSRHPDFAGGKQAGQVQIKKDMNRFFRVIPDERKAWLNTKKGKQALLNFYGPLATAANLNAGVNIFVQLHKAARGMNKRITKRSSRLQKVPIWRTTFDKVFLQLLKWQGWVPSGWMKGAGEAQVSAPSWISGKNGAGSIVKTLTDAKTLFRVVNNTNHEDCNNIQFNINYALVQQANAMNREFEFYLKKLKLS